VNGGQGLNTGLADAFNLIWKLHMVLRFGAPAELLKTYEEERKPVAMSVVQTSGELVRATKHSKDGTHAQDYVKVVERRAGNITGMGVRYGDEGLCGTRVFDFMVRDGQRAARLYSLLDYAGFTLLAFGEEPADLGDLPAYVKVIRISSTPRTDGYWAERSPYANQLLLIRPDAYIAAVSPLTDATGTHATVPFAGDAFKP
jgi:hypothetical protein